MSLRTRLLFAFAAIVVIPIALLAIGLRQEMTRRLSQEYQVRVDSVVEVIRDDLTRESAGIAERLAATERALRDDNRFRLAAVAGVESEREYLFDYAGTAMRLTGLSMLQVHDGEGRIISSGQGSCKLGVRRQRVKLSVEICGRQSNRRTCCGRIKRCGIP